MESRAARLLVRTSRARSTTHRIEAVCAVLCVAWSFSNALSAQQLLDRVVAHVNGTAILLTDVRAGVALGLADPLDPVQGLIDRQLQLAEVARFPPADPGAAAVDAEVGRLQGRAGSALPALMASVGFDETHLREIARDSLRIQAYLEQRFGTGVPVSEEQALQYFREHLEEFRRDGETPLFEEVAAVARQRASAERRGLIIEQWLLDLRGRAEIVRLPDAGR